VAQLHVLQKFFQKFQKVLQMSINPCDYPASFFSKFERIIRWSQFVQSLSECAVMQCGDISDFQDANPNSFF
jgi:hypothetical protein